MNRRAKKAILTSLMVSAVTAALTVTGCNASSGEVPQPAVQETESQGTGVSAVPSEITAPPEITALPELMFPSTADFPMEYDEKGDIIFFADVDHDGEGERIELNMNEYKDRGGAGSVLKVRLDNGADSPVIWEREYAAPHAGQTMLYLYREAGQDYLMEYYPGMYQGYASYFLHLFSLDSDGNPLYLHEYEAGFALHENREDGFYTGFYGDAEAFVSFLEQVQHYIEGALLLVSTDNGNLSYSTPENPITIFHDDSF